MITKSERDDLARIVRMRAKLARDGIAAREAELAADVEEQLSAVYDFDEHVWSEITAQAAKAVEQADAKIAAICRELGVPERFRPQLALSWYSRGENAIAKRRSELRELARKRIAAAGQAAKLEISRRELEASTELYSARLESAEAAAFLDRLPTVEALMPPLSVAELGADPRPRGSGAPVTRNSLLRAQVATKLLAGPDLSNREIARQLGASPTTVGKLRAKLSTADADPSSLDTDVPTPDGGR